MYNKYLHSVWSVCCLPVANETKLFGIWWSNISLSITCHVSICNSLPAQIRSVTYSNPLAMTPLVNETLLFTLTCYAACYGPSALCTQYVYFHIHTVHLDIIKVFYSPNDALVNCLKNNFTQNTSVCGDVAAATSPHTDVF
jgi:hypothetical protein